VYWSTAPLLPSLEWVGNLGSSTFFTTVFGALAGAFAGAWAAQRIAERNKLREELQKELRNINAGITLALTTSNLATAIKKQHIRDMKKTYDADRERLEVHMKKGDNWQDRGPFQLSLNLLAFQELNPPIGTLQEIVMGRLSTAGRALASVTSLSDAFGNLNYAISKRNELIERMKEGKLPEGAEAGHFYLGRPYAEGKTNNEYGSYVDSMVAYTDDAIFFSLTLCEDLQTHGKHIAKKHKKMFGGEAPRVSTIDVEQARKEDLIPNDDDYASWLSGFQSSEREAIHWWQGPKKAARYVASLRAK
jgi:hypothetical protein